MFNERTFRASDAARLEDPTRLEYLPPDEAAARLSLKPGMIVADIGAGTGFFAIPFARHVAPGGRVLAVDLQAEMLELLGGKARGRAEAATIERAQGTASATGLPDGCCELVFLANIWHELDDHEAVLAECARLLRPGGRTAILDWRADLSGPPGPPTAHRVAQAEVEAQLGRHGWRVADAAPFGPFSYLVVTGPRAGG